MKLWLSEARIVALGERGFFTADQFLGRDEALAAREAARGLSLKQAGVGRGGQLRTDRRRRGDAIAWVTPGDAPPALMVLWERFEALRQALNEGAWLGLRSFELQVAHYPGDGTGYVKHKDAFVGDASRRMTALVYLNPDWEPGHGGQLRIHVGGETLDVEPRLDHAVVFRSDTVMHEVLPAYAPRWAATAWFR